MIAHLLSHASVLALVAPFAFRPRGGGKGFLIGGQGTNDQQPNYTGIQIQTAVWTLPRPVIGGTVKMAPNVIDAVNFQSHDANGGKGLGDAAGAKSESPWSLIASPIRAAVWAAMRLAGKGGKGGGKDYTASVEMALCEGQVDGVPLVFVNGTTLKDLTDLGMTLFTGAFPYQAPWSYLADNGFSGDAPYGYPGIAYLARANYDLGSSASVPNHEMLVQKTSGFQATWCNPSTINATTYPKLAAAFPSGIPTADMALFIQDCLTNTQYGVWNFPSSAINTATLLTGGGGNDAAAQTYWRALGLGFIFKMDSTETFQSSLDRWLKIGNCAGVWSGKSLKFIPYGDAVISANGVTYTPNLTPVYSRALNDDDFVGDSRSDPVKVDRTDPSQTYDIVRLEVTMDDGWFSYVPVEARSQNAMELAGAPKIMPSVEAHEILGQTNGLLCAQLLLKQQQLWRNTVTIKLSREYILLEPMDFIPVTDPAIGYINQMCRVLSVNEDENGELTVVLQKYIPGSSTVSGNYGNGQATGHTIPDQGQTASNVSTPVIVEPSSALSGTPQVWIVACGGAGTFDPHWGGAQVQLSTDNTNYKHVGDITERGRIGALTANLASYGGSNPDTTNTLYVDLSESQGTLETVSSGDAANGTTLCYVGGELLSFQTATLVSQTATNEAHTIPSVTPYLIAVNNAPTWVSDGGVIYTIGGGSLTYTAGTPGPGQYTHDSAGNYTFNAADAGKGVKITYNWNNPYHYALTTLYRGLYGTSAGSHSTGAQFARLDDATFKVDLPSWAIGQTIYIKLPSYTAFGGNYPGLQDISGLTAYTYTPSGSGYGGGSGGVPSTPTGLTGQAKGPSGNGFNYLHWNTNPSSDNVLYYNILRKLVGGVSYAIIDTAVGTSYNDTTAMTGDAYLYELEAVNSIGASSAEGPVTVTTN